MAAKRINCTIESTQLAYCKEKNLKPSRLLRRKINELMQAERNPLDSNERMRELNRQISELVEKNKKFEEFLQISSTKNAQLNKELEKLRNG
jgi:uncharacterized protein involved in exopolysaccharide biosynthesis